MEIISPAMSRTQTHSTGGEGVGGGLARTNVSYCKRQSLVQSGPSLLGLECTTALLRKIENFYNADVYTDTCFAR